MGTVLAFGSLATSRPRERDDPVSVGEIVIFPGVRIERDELDLGHRLRNSPGRDDGRDLGKMCRPHGIS